MNIEIKDIKYEESTTVKETTPLGNKRDVVIPIDNIVVTFSVDDGDEHILNFKPEAIANRLVGYSLEEESHAIESLVRERVFDWSELQPLGNTRVELNGGTDDRIKVTWNTTAKNKIASVLKPHSDRIELATAFYTERDKERENGNEA